MIALIAVGIAGVVAGLVIGRGDMRDRPVVYVDPSWLKRTRKS